MLPTRLLLLVAPALSEFGALAFHPLHFFEGHSLHLEQPGHQGPVCARSVWRVEIPDDATAGFQLERAPIAGFGDESIAAAKARGRPAKEGEEAAGRLGLPLPGDGVREWVVF